MACAAALATLDVFAEDSPTPSPTPNPNPNQVALAILAIIIYPVGIPLLYMVLLKSAHEAIAQVRVRVRGREG